MKKRQSIVLIEVLTMIAILSIITIGSATKVGDIFDKPKDLAVQRSLKIYEDAAVVLTASSKDFTESNINKQV